MSNKRRVAGMAVMVAAFVYGGFLVGRSIPHRSAAHHTALASAQTSVPVGLAPGDQAPNFSLSSTQGQLVTLSSLRGHPVWLNFWATWCPWCKKEIPEIIQVKQQYGTGIDIYGIDEEQAQATVVQYMQSKHMNYPVLLDSQGIVAGTYGVQAFPTSVFINANGRIAGVYTGAFLSRSQMDPYLASIMKPANP
ncbi:MAG: TlpA family protein disulfide reductase [Sulfobacillus sp.]